LCYLPLARLAALLSKTNLSGPAAVSASEAAGAFFDGQINWAAAANANLRPEVIRVAKSCEPINGLVERIRGWADCLGTLNWNNEPEVPGR